ncbi:MAG: hypothetical protein ACP5VQ_05385 [Phycisphaerae bacterium]
MNTVAIQEWINHQPNKWLATCAAAIARVGVDLPQMVAVFGKRWPGVAADAGDWIRLYRNHRSIAGAVQGALPGGPDTMLAADAARAIHCMSRDELRFVAERMTPEDRQAAVQAGRAQAKAFENAMATVAYNDVQGAGELAGFGGEIPIELRFLAQVVLPYLIEHGDLPTRDFARARRGDLAALERLVTIDPSVIAEPRVAEQIAASVLVSDRIRLRVLTDAISKKPSSAKAGQCKILMAAVIVATFENAEVAISVADVRGLFDALAKSDKGVLVDTDLPDSPEAMSKGIQRYKKFWRPMIGRMASLGTGQKLS